MFSEHNGRYDVRAGTVESLIERLYTQDQLSRKISKVENSYNCSF